MSNCTIFFYRVVDRRSMCIGDRKQVSVVGLHTTNALNTSEKTIESEKRNRHSNAAAGAANVRNEKKIKIMSAFYNVLQLWWFATVNWSNYVLYSLHWVLHSIYHST